MPIRVIPTEKIPGKQYKIGKAILLPDHVANILLESNKARLPGVKDEALEAKAQESVEKSRKAAEDKARDDHKAHSAEVAAEVKKLGGKKESKKQKKARMRAEADAHKEAGVPKIEMNED
jgi:hypothetical protein